MEPAQFYDEVALIYDRWIAHDPALDASLNFYVDEAARHSGSILEIGIGNGRIGSELARRGRTVIGVDCSSEMLRVCRARALKASVPSHRLLLVQADATERCTDRCIGMVLMPFRTIGHFLSVDERASVFKAAYDSLVSGGAFVFDHFVFDPVVAEANHGKESVINTWAEGNTSIATLTHRHFLNTDAKTLDCRLTLTAATSVSKLDYRLSWLYPAEVRQLADNMGFAEAALYGSFDRSHYCNGCHEQIWVLTRR